MAFRRGAIAIAFVSVFGCFPAIAGEGPRDRPPQSPELQACLSQVAQVYRDEVYAINLMDVSEAQKSIRQFNAVLRSQIDRGQCYRDHGAGFNPGDLISPPVDP